MNDTPQLMPLRLHMEGCATESEMNANVTATLSRGYTPINHYMNMMLGETVHLCGAGPSLRDTWKQIPDNSHVMACNSAIGYLIERGCEPTWGMIWDASELCENFAVPHPDVTYLIGARCHPKVFERLRGCKVVVWHAGGDHNILPFLMERDVREPLVNGGTACVTRGIYLLYAIGYRHFHIHGADSSYSQEGETHITGSLVPEKKIQIFVNERWFDTTPEWCAQVEEIKMIYPIFRASPLNSTFEVYGDGMFQHVVRTMQADEPAAQRNLQYMMQQAAAEAQTSTT